MCDSDTEDMDVVPVPGKRIPWVEKYRPEKVEDVSHQNEVVQTLKSAIDHGGSIPHLMFYGPPGTGKTTTVLAMARELYGPELYKQRILELNASDERGIKVVREKIKTFAQGAVGSQKTPGYPCPRFKIIILDEADTMTPDAQSALRRVMEIYSKVTRFCLICNYVTRIIEPLASRCAKFRFQPLPTESMVARLTFIAEQERMRMGEGVLDVLMQACGGDMRKAVGFLQSAHDLSGGGSALVTADMVHDVSGQIPAEVTQHLFEIIKTAKTFNAVRACVTDITLEGYAMGDLLMQVHDTVVNQEGLSDLAKALICEKIAESDKCIVDGASEKLQFLDVAAFIMRQWATVADGVVAGSTL